MSNFHKIDPRELTCAFYQRFEEQWPLLTAGTREDLNTMTVGRGGLGVCWGLPIATVYVRPQRHTFGYMEKNGLYTLSFLGEKYRKVLQFCGSKSGRDVDKVKECGLTVELAECGAPYFAEAELVIVSKKLYAQDMTAESFTDRAAGEKWYPLKDYHRIYMGEIVEVLEK